jgi:hypothetical protein
MRLLTSTRSPRDDHLPSKTQTEFLDDRQPALGGPADVRSIDVIGTDSNSDRPFRRQWNREQAPEPARRRAMGDQFADSSGLSRPRQP